MGAWMDPEVGLSILYKNLARSPVKLHQNNTYNVVTNGLYICFLFGGGRMSWLRPSVLQISTSIQITKYNIVTCLWLRD
jgi:hypothetical protein